MHKIITLFRFWLSGIRLYIAMATVLISLQVWWWAHTLFGGTQLEVIRMQEVYGWLSFLYLALALLIGPVTKLFPKLPGRAVVFDARRALGISAAWFALLHASIAYFKQFQAIHPLQLPEAYQLSFVLGVIGLLILSLMAATSVNAIMKHWGIWWFRVHRLVYVAVIVVLIHAFMIGAHAVQTASLITLSALALLWICLNIAALVRSHEVKLGRVLAICVSIIVLAGAMTYGLTQRYEQIQAAEQAKGHGHK